ncbi:bifunctional phosphopantothenoylcysteine decarboxylase/phosphopantothenate--cysteine ligase CoaBC [Candidatus Pelagibacter sp.]|nr:bifunctional phosphopantothenoylcysteine decarboxylase/phosphopantothenate--cysteine ligase CoaBC [Candidatus Pelagibacter sp.]
MNFLEKKKILLIISGGIAAYKSLDLIRSLTKLQCEIKTILTKGGTEFVTPLSVASLSKNKVYSDIYSAENETEMDHISLSRWADLILIAPATSNIIAKMSQGISDDLATTVVQASNKNIFVCPAMNVRMWEHASNKQNIEKIKSYNYRIIGPFNGEMACGEYGDGRMADIEYILKELDNFFKSKSNNKKFRAIVTAGPTREYIDPVRYISNRSSGKQGYEIAKSLFNNGIETTLISGPSKLIPDPNINFLKVNTAEEMYKKTVESLPCDVAIFCAAVGDFKVKNLSEDKIKKNKDLNLDFEKNIDILKLISKNNNKPKLVIGFSAETSNLHLNSKQKLQNKGCDWIIANDVSKKDIGFDSDFNEVSIFYKDKNVVDEIIPKTYKSVVADEIVKRVINQLNLI